MVARLLSRRVSADLSFLLNSAVALIQPSLWEGFGIPIVEAMGCGKPVLVSNTSSLPEVMGNAGILIDPKNQEELTNAMKNILTDDWRVKKIFNADFSFDCNFCGEKIDTAEEFVFYGKGGRLCKICYDDVMDSIYENLAPNQE